MMDMLHVYKGECDTSPSTLKYLKEIYILSASITSEMWFLSSF